MIYSRKIEYRNVSIPQTCYCLATSVDIDIVNATLIYKKLFFPKKFNYFCKRQSFKTTLVCYKSYE
jgi:hypothetical protein